MKINRYNSTWKRTKKIVPKFKKSLLCYREPQTHHLRSLSDHFNLNVRVWKGNKLDQEFGPNNPTKIDVEFRPSDGGWNLRGKSGCLLKLVAQEFITSLIQSLAKTDEKPQIRRLNFYDGVDLSFTRELLWMSQGKLTHTSTRDLTAFAHPRKNSSHRPHPRPRDAYGCIEDYSEKSRGRKAGFLMFAQQDLLCHYTLANEEVSDQIEEFKKKPTCRDPFEMSVTLDVAEMKIPQKVLPEPPLGAYWKCGQREPNMYEILSVQLKVRFVSAGWDLDPRREKSCTIIYEFAPILDYMPWRPPPPPKSCSQPNRRQSSSPNHRSPPPGGNRSPGAGRRASPRRIKPTLRSPPPKR